MRRSTVRSGEVELAVFDRAATGRSRTGSAGDRAPVVLLLHGYPDTHEVWDPVASQLARAGARVIAYDVRGAGESGEPASRSGYHVDRLVDDLVAVLDHLLDHDERVHLVGHDWGSVQLWDAVTREAYDTRLRGRIATFTSISGPSLDHLACYGRRVRRRRDWSALRDQVRASWYVYAFHLPWLPEWVWRHRTSVLRTRLNRVERLGDGHWAPTLAQDGAHGLNLYRANVRPRMSRPRPGRTRVPVQLLVPIYDHYVRPPVVADLAAYAPRSRRVDIADGHWVIRRDPDRVAALITEWAALEDGAERWRRPG